MALCIESIRMTVIYKLSPLLLSSYASKSSSKNRYSYHREIIFNHQSNMLKFSLENFFTTLHYIRILCFIRLSIFSQNLYEKCSLSLSLFFCLSQIIISIANLKPVEHLFETLAIPESFISILSLDCVFLCKCIFVWTQLKKSDLWRDSLHPLNIMVSIILRIFDQRSRIINFWGNKFGNLSNLTNRNFFIPRFLFLSSRVSLWLRLLGCMFLHV